MNGGGGCRTRDQQHARTYGDCTATSCMVEKHNCLLAFHVENFEDENGLIYTFFPANLRITCKNQRKKM